jgi:hypothetical protein
MVELSSCGVGNFLRKIIIGIMGKGGNGRAETQKLKWNEAGQGKVL